jgi:pSer/pThr/pTyr-binding forkhead associated (FHA) protein
LARTGSIRCAGDWIKWACAGSGGSGSKEDLDSTNGIKVNGKRRKKTPLVDGDKLKVGQVEFLFRSLLTF